MENFRTTGPISGAKQWTVQKRLILSFSALTVMSMILGGLALYGETESQKSIHEIGEVRLPSVKSLQYMTLSATKIAADERFLLQESLTPEKRQQLTEEVNEYWAIFKENQELYSSIYHEPEEKVLWEQFKEDYKVWEQHHKELLSLNEQIIESPQDSEERKMLLAEINEYSVNNNEQSFPVIYDQLLELTEMNVEISDVEVAAAVSHSASLKAATIVAVVIAFLASVLLSFIIIRSLNGTLKNIIDRLTAGASEVNASSEQLSDASQQLAESSSQQAASLEETSSSLEEMASQIKHTAENSGEAELAMKNAKPMIEQGVEAMKRMNSAMSEIQNSSAETSKIIKTIDDIAFQTNLLALNAAVEAARAGEAGKGFAVVAEEVRNLAQRSAEAAKDTSELIASSQNASERGGQVAEEVSTNLEKIEESIASVSTLVLEISAASREQAEGIEQMTTVMSEMDNVVQNNASSSEETASSAEELSSQANELNNIIASLKSLVESENTGTSGISISKPEGYSLNTRKKFSGILRDKKEKYTPEQKGEVVPHKGIELIPFDEDDDFGDF